MEQIEIGGQSYTIGRLNAFDQMHVSRKLSPLVPTLVPVIAELAQGGLSKALEAIDDEELDDVEAMLSQFDLNNLNGLSAALKPLTEAWSQMSEDDVDFIMIKCLSVCARNGAKVCVNKSLMFDDLEMPHMLALVLAVVRSNMGNFIQGLLMQASRFQKQST